MRPSDGLASEDNDEGKDHDARRQCFARVVWSISSATRVVATIQGEVEIVPPFRFVRVPSRRGRGDRDTPDAAALNGVDLTAVFRITSSEARLQLSPGQALGAGSHRVDARGGSATITYSPQGTVAGA